MNFNKFKKEYRAMAKAETPDAPMIPSVETEKKPRLTQRPAFRYAMAALSLLLVVGISLTAVYAVPKSNVSGVVTAEGKPALTRCASYDDLDAFFSEAKDKYKENIGRGMMWKSTTASGAINDTIEDIQLGELPEADLSYGEYYYTVEESRTSPADIEDGGVIDYSGTNVQVDGVDEADIVKTDGKFVYVTNGGKVLVFDVRNPSNIVLSSTINVDNLLNNSVYGYARVADMFLEGDLLTVVFSAEKESYQDKRLYSDYYFGMRSSNEFGIAVYDVSNPAAPETVRYYTQEGSYVSSRRIGEYVYIVTNKYFSVGDYDGSPKEVVPCRCDSAVSDRHDPIAPDCIYLGEDASNFLTLGAVNIKDASEPAGTVTVMGAGYTVYASRGAIYVFGTSYREAEATDDGIVSDIYDGDYGYVFSGIMTDIYKFTIKGAELAFAASGSVKGSMINQFAADEYEGNLRVATNYEAYTTKEDNTVEFFSENGITILDENLDKLGELTGLAKDEYIKSVRFNGATGYVVTFRTVDPLFAFDLSDPRNPVVTGELKIPGYSEYMHIYNESTILGIGQDATAESEDADIAYYQGLKIALFDVTDPDNMAEIDTYYLGDRGTTSEVEYDHKALAYYASRDVFGIPVELFTFEGEQENIYDYGEFDSYSFCVFSMGGGEKISLVSKIQQIANGSSEYDKTRRISRGLFIGDNVVTISDDMIQINNFATGELLDNLVF